MGAPARRAWRDLAAHPVQGVALALMISVVTVIAAGSPHMRRVLAETQAGWTDELALADLEVVVSPTNADVAARARAVPGVAVAEARLILPAEVTGPAVGGRMPALVRRLSTRTPPDVDRLAVLTGRLPGSDEPALVVDRSLAALHGIGPGARLTLVVRGRQADLPVVGVVLSAEDALFPVHPEYEMPVRGALAVVHASPAALKGVSAEHDLGTLVDSVRIRLAPGASAQDVAGALDAALGTAPLAVVRRSEDPTQRTVRHMLQIVDVFVPPMILVLFGLGALVVTTVMARAMRRAVPQVGALLALGHGRARVAASFLLAGWAPTVVGLALGLLGEQAYVARVYGDYVDGLGFPPARDAGWGAEIPWTLGVWLAVATLSTLLPGLLLVRTSPAVLLRRGTRLTAPALGGAASRKVATLARALRVPMSWRLALAQMRRRILLTTAGVLCLAGVFTVLLAFVATYVTVEEEATEAARRVGLDAVVRFERVVPAAALAEVAARAEGTAEPLVTGLAWCRHGEAWTPLRAVGVGAGGWREVLLVSHGRRPAADAAEEVLLDRWIGEERGLAVGDRVTLFRDRNAPEGLDVVIVGWVKSATAIQVYLPLERARTLLELPDLSTGAQVTSSLPPRVLEERLREAPQVATVRALGNAVEEVLTSFGGGRTLNFAAMLAAVAIAGLFLAITTSLDNDEREGDVVVLHALGWRNRSLAALCVGETLLRGGLAVLLATVAAPWLSRFLLGRMEAVMHYALEPRAPAWLPFALAGLTLLVLPAAAWPAFRAARDVSPARVLRRLSAE